MKYIIFDMDDTLLNDRREISAYSLDVLKKVQAMGHKLVCNTARSKGFNQKFFDQLQPDYAILNGGALIIDKDENVVFRAEVDVPTTQALVRDLLELTDTVSVQTEDTFYSHKGWHTVQKAVPFDFEQEQFQSTGKHAVFVPSGGQGSDEVISESESMKRCLMEMGVPEERILNLDILQTRAWWSLHKMG